MSKTDSLKVEVPYRPRRWAIPFHASFKRWLALILHRRAGKTTAIINHLQRAAMDDGWESARLRSLATFTDEEITRLLKRRHYAHFLPTRVQAKATAWDSLKEIARPIPGVKFNESELLVTYPNGNKVQLFGSDDPDSARGLTLSGAAFDEYSQIASNLFSEIVSKALADHLGFAIWGGTIKGADQLYATYQAAKDSDEWFALWQDVDVSLSTEEGATITALKQAMADERKLVAQGLMSQAEYDQEWYLSPEAAIKGAFYLDEMTAARQDGRITRVPYDPSLPVDTDWDLGIDAMAIWFSQRTRSGETRLIDYHEDIGGGLIACIATLKNKGYIYGEHWAPHDIETREISSATTRKQFAASHGLMFKVTPKIAIEDGITAVKARLPLCWFDETKCKAGLDALRHYKRTWQQKFNQFSATPVHDWACVTGDTKVLTRYGTYQIKYLPYEGEVLTTCGWKRYEDPKITRRNAGLVAVMFEGGYTVRCTPEHRFLTVSGWKFASQLRKGSAIQSGSTHSRTILEEISIGFGRVNDIGQRVARGFIAMFGKPLLERFQTVATFITKMEILLTTGSPISNACPAPNTYRVNGIERNPEKQNISLLPLEVRPQNGIARKREGCGILEPQSERSHGPNGSGKSARASIAARSWMRLFERAEMLKNTALKPAKLLRIESVTELTGKENVWCLTVPDGAQFALENGAIVHNSHGSDAFRGHCVRYKMPEAERPYNQPQPHYAPNAWLTH